MKSFREKLVGVLKMVINWFTFLLFTAVILVCVGGISVGPFYWAICVFAGAIAGITLRARYLGGWKASAIIGATILASKGISIFLYGKDPLMGFGFHVVDFVFGGILFATIFLWFSGLWKSLHAWLMGRI